MAESGDRVMAGSGDRVMAGSAERIRAAGRHVLLAVVVIVIAAMLLPADRSQAQPEAPDVVRRLAGDDRAWTAARIAADGWTSADTVVLVDGGIWTDSLIGAHLAARLDVPVLVSGATMPAVTRDTITTLGVRRLIVVGDADDGSADGRVGPAAEVQRIRAPDASSLAVAAVEVAAVEVEGGPTDPPTVVTSDVAFPDALAAGNLAPAQVLLTDPVTLSPATADAIRKLTPDRVTVIGGSEAVADAVLQQIRDLGPQVDRIAGDTRYATAEAAAATRPAGSGGIASGLVHADAIAAVPWASRSDAAILLTPHDAMLDTTVDHVAGSGRTAALVARGSRRGRHASWTCRSGRLSGTAVPDPVHAVRPLTERSVEWDDRGDLARRMPGAPRGPPGARAVPLRPDRQHP